MLNYTIYPIRILQTQIKDIWSLVCPHSSFHFHSTLWSIIIISLKRLFIYISSSLWGKIFNASLPPTPPLSLLCWLIWFLLQVILTCVLKFDLIGPSIFCSTYHWNRLIWMFSPKDTKQMIEPNLLNLEF